MLIEVLHLKTNFYPRKLTLIFISWKQILGAINTQKWNKNHQGLMNYIR